MNGYMFEYDDPYKILAHYVIGFYRPADVLRVLTENSYIFTLIQKEVRGLDIGGNFLDCIIEDILAEKKRMEYMGNLDKLAQYYFSKLDKDRLRNEIRNILAEMNIDYSSGGSDSSAKTNESPVRV